MIQFPDIDQSGVPKNDCMTIRVFPTFKLGPISDSHLHWDDIPPINYREPFHERPLEKCIDVLLYNRGIEKDENGNLVLYHATPQKNYESLWDDKVIRRPQDTKERTWRTSAEEIPELLRKTYLAGTFYQAGAISNAIGEKIGGYIYILRVRIPSHDFEKLRPDEDTKKTTWYRSLIGPYSVCSFEGEITDFDVVGKTNYLHKSIDMERLSKFKKYLEDSNAHPAAVSVSKNALDAYYQRIRREKESAEERLFEHFQKDSSFVFV